MLLIKGLLWLLYKCHRCNVNLSLRVLYYGCSIILHLISQLEHVVNWNDTFLSDVSHYHPRKVEVFERLTELVKSQMRQLVVDKQLLQVVYIANDKIRMSDVYLLFNLVSYSW